MEFGHHVLMALYLVTPLVTAVWALSRWKRARRRAKASLAGAAILGLALGLGLNIAYAFLAGGRVRVPQVLLSSYLLLSVILILRALNKTMEIGLRTLFNVGRRSLPTTWYAFRAGSAVVLRNAILVMLGLPFVMASVMVFRPKVGLTDDPQTQLGYPFQKAEFVTTDDVPIRGWFIPSGDKPSKDTVIVCHGLGANKSNQLTLAAHFVPQGFNLLIFDFRAHGESGGQISSFGDLERNDVLAAVHWLRENHPNQSRRIYGVGASMGAAALLAAAGEDTDDARSIDAIAVYGTYDSLYSLANDVVTAHFLPPMDWLCMRIALPLASLHAGTRLSHFAPERSLDHIAPRPILFIHGQPDPKDPNPTGDQIIPFAHGKALYDAASQPKYFLWVPKGDHNNIINDEGIGKVVREFFKSSMSML